jgi:hypothetical protein
MRLSRFCRSDPEFRAKPLDIVHDFAHRHPQKIEASLSYGEAKVKRINWMVLRKPTVSLGPRRTNIDGRHRRRCCLIAHLFRSAGPASRGAAHRAHCGARGDEIRLAAAERGVRQAVRRGDACVAAEGGEELKSH